MKKKTLTEQIDTYARSVNSEIRLYFRELKREFQTEVKETLQAFEVRLKQQEVNFSFCDKQITELQLASHTPSNPPLTATQADAQSQWQNNAAACMEILDRLQARLDLPDSSSFQIQSQKYQLLTDTRLELCKLDIQQAHAQLSKLLSSSHQAQKLGSSTQSD